MQSFAIKITCALHSVLAAQCGRMNGRDPTAKPGHLADD
jgi:hypothetical protein